MVTAAVHLVIEVTDNGTGIPGTVARSGLHNLTTRARVFGGTLTVDRPSDGGPGWSGPLRWGKRHRREPPLPQRPESIVRVSLPLCCNASRLRMRSGVMRSCNEYTSCVT